MTPIPMSFSPLVHPLLSEELKMAIYHLESIGLTLEDHEGHEREVGQLLVLVHKLRELKDVCKRFDESCTNAYAPQVK